MQEKDIFLREWQREFETTLKVLKAYPEDKKDLKPTDKNFTARELAWMFVAEQKVLLWGALDGNIDPSKFTPAPSSFKEIIAEYEKSEKETVERLKNLKDEDLAKAVDFYVGPKTPGKVPVSSILWISLFDQIHHRGQFSVYLRLAGAKVPSIYGPTADEPWM